MVDHRLFLNLDGINCVSSPQVLFVNINEVWFSQKLSCGGVGFREGIRLYWLRTIVPVHPQGEILVFIVMLRGAFDIHLMGLLTGNIPRMLYLSSQPFRIFMHHNLVDLREPVL